MAQEKESSASSWLSRYATNYHAWRRCSSPSGIVSFKRPIGLTETSFDSDGSYFGGRADMNALFTLQIRHTLSKEALRRRIALAWTNLRLAHVLLMSRHEDDAESGKRYFVIDIPSSAEDAIRRVEKEIVWLEDYYEDIDVEKLYHHGLNVARIIKPKTCMSKMHVLPLEQAADGTCTLRLYIIMAHQISDGLSAYTWFNHLTKILNQSEADIKSNIETLSSASAFQDRLPPAQEDLYPPIAGNKARQRWFWAILRVLRHVQQVLPPTFTNPLLRTERLSKPIALPPTFDKIFDYSLENLPPMNSGQIGASLSRPASTRLMALCRDANVSIGAGCFALAGISMMEMHEARYADVPEAERPAFAASFPLNPRAFFAKPPSPDSCMLAFSEGIVMPFLPSSLPIEGRFKLVAKHANRELKVYQKRLKKAGETIVPGLDKFSPGRLLASGYIAQISRVNAKTPTNQQFATDPQGDLEPRIGQYGATCGVSSVGSTAGFFRQGATDLNNMEGKDLAADYRGLKVGVRARENEFLVGSSTDWNGIVGFGVSYDLSGISQEAAQAWKQKIESLLERNNDSKL